MHRFPIIFPDFLLHSEVATVTKCLKPEYAPVSAGSINSIDFEVYGDSSTLALTSDPEDSKVIRMFDYFHGYDSPIDMPDPES